MWIFVFYLSLFFQQKYVIGWFRISNCIWRGILGLLLSCSIACNFFSLRNRAVTWWRLFLLSIQFLGICLLYWNLAYFGIFSYLLNFIGREVIRKIMWIHLMRWISKIRIERWLIIWLKWIAWRWTILIWDKWVIVVWFIWISIFFQFLIFSTKVFDMSETSL